MEDSKSKIKEERCLNCSYLFEKGKDNFCPDCGQKNSNRQVSFKTLFMDFLADFFTFDSKLFRSLFLLVVKPGFLSKENIAGKRVSYIPPLRMLLLTGILFFMLDSFKTSYAELNGIKQEDLIADNFLIDDESVFPETTYSLSSETGIRTDSVGATPPPAISLNTEGELNATSPDSLKKEKQPFVRIGSDTISVEVLNRWRTLVESAQENELSEQEILDSVKFEGVINEKIGLQVIKVIRSKGTGIRDYMYSNMSLYVLAITPLFAFLLLILHWRHPEFYMDHLMFSFHFHSVFYLLLIVNLFLSWNYAQYLGPISLVLLLYLFVALKQCYEQSWKKSALKTGILFVLYSISLGLFISFAALLAFVLF